MKKYLQSCKAESDYILNYIKGNQDILSIGCGPAIIEAKLAECGFNVTGLDISREALGQAEDSIRTIEGSAEKTGFVDRSFDAVIYVASLQFIEGYRQAVTETARVLRTSGKLLVMLLNPRSGFFKEKISNPDSYVSRIRHKNLKEIEEVIKDYFFSETEYFLGIRNMEVFLSSDPAQTALYIIKGIKKTA